MLFCKTTHKGNFVKEILQGNFTEPVDNTLNNIKTNTNNMNNVNQLLVVTEKSLELYDYIYDEFLQTPYLEPKFNQELFLHILDCKVINNKSAVVLLTTCGLLVMKYCPKIKLFTPLCSEILNINCEHKDRLMYLQTNDKLGVIVAYSNTDQFFIYKLNESASAITLINASRCKSTAYILDVFILQSNENEFEFIVYIISRMVDIIIEDCLKFNKNLVILNNSIDYIEKKEDRIAKVLTFANSNKSLLGLNNFYRVFLSNFGNFLFIIAENGFLCLDINENNPQNCVVYLKKFVEKSNIFISSLIFANFIQIDFENKLFIFEVDVYNNKIKRVKVKGSKYTNKKVLRVFENDFHFVYYDNKMNFILTNYCLEPNQLNQNIIIKIKTINSYNDNSFYCLDSVLFRSNNENVVYSICGFKGSSKLIKYEKALSETKFEVVEFVPTNKVFVLENCENLINQNYNNQKLIFMSSADKTHVFSLSQNLVFTHLKNEKNNFEKILNQKAISVTQHNNINQLSNFYCHIASHSLNIYQLAQDFSDIINLSSFTFNINIVSGCTFTYQGLIYFCLYFSTGSFAVYYYDATSCSFIEDCVFKFQQNVSCFDVAVQPDSHRLILVICTFENRIDLYKYEMQAKTFDFCSNLNLTNNDNSQIVPESVRIFDCFVCFSTITGEFCMFYMDELAIQQLIYSFTVPGPKDILTISEINFNELINKTDYKSENSDKSFSVNLYNSSQAFMLEVRVDESKNIKIAKFKFLIKSQKNAKNEITFLKNIKLSSLNLTIYQNSNQISISTFSKPMNNSLTPDLVKEFHYNQLARRVLQFDERTMIILIESYAGVSNNLISNLLYIYHCNSGNSGVMVNIEEKVKINSMKSFSLDYKNEENEYITVKYLALCGKYCENDTDSRGVLYLYQCGISNEGELNEIIFIKKMNLVPVPAYDLCHINDFLIISCENEICGIKLELDHKERRIVFGKDGIKQALNTNRIISLNEIRNSYSFIIGDSNESFSMMEYDPKTKRFETIAVDLALRSLYKALPDGDSTNSVVLLQKNGVFSKLTQKEELYQVNYCFDAKEFINRSHILKPYYICTTILGSIFTFYEVSLEDLLTNYGITQDELLNFQKFLVKNYSKWLFNVELPLETLRNMVEPNKNTFLLDFTDTLIHGGNSFIKIDQEFKNSYGKILEITVYLSEMIENIF